MVRVLREGYRILFQEDPPPLSAYPINPSGYADREKNEAMRQEIQSLLQKRAIEEVDNPGPGYYSRVFLRRKKTGGWRPILDLKAINPLIACPKFKQETPKSIKLGLRKNHWAFSVDLQDAFFHVAVHKKSRKFLRFLFEGRTYQYRVLPFGMKPSPYVFTKVVGEMKAMLHKEALQLFMFLDDWLGQTSTREIGLEQVKRVTGLCQELGLLINTEKSELAPKQQFDFIGMHFNLNKFTVACTQKNIQNVNILVTETLTRRAWTARKWLTVIGVLQSQCALTPYGSIYLRPLQFQLSRNWRQGRDPPGNRVPLTKETHRALRWWLKPSHLSEGVPIHALDPTVRTFTDASTTGWGGHVGEQRFSGLWTEEESRLHINVLELRALKLVLRLCNPPEGAVILAATDNSTVVAYVNRLGGTRSWSLWKETQDMFQLVMAKKWTIKARHIAGVLNVLADRLSRRGQILPTEWSLHQEAANLMFQRWGPALVDLFATRDNKKCPTFVSPFPDTLAVGTDALSISWEAMSAYAFPPQAILDKVLQKISQTGLLRLILVTPLWPKQAWYPELVRLATEGPVPLPKWKHLLRQPQGNLYHTDLDSLNLQGWLVVRKT